MSNSDEKKCLWCLNTSSKVTFEKKAHTIPKSLGGQNYNQNVCDSCNEYFGNRQDHNYSIEEALKETFNISRQRFLETGNAKRKIGRFKSKFFEIKERKGKYRLSLRPSFRLDTEFQVMLCRSFKRGLYKMYLEELNRQKDTGFELKYDPIRQFARFNEGDMPVFYYTRLLGVVLMLKREAETPILLFDRMKYLYSDDYFAEIEFLGHVFGFPICEFEKIDLESYFEHSFVEKKKFFKQCIIINKLTDVDLTLNIMNH